MEREVFYQVNKPIIHEKMEDEVVLINLQSGDYFNMHGSCSNIWLLIVACASKSEIINTLQKKYEGESQVIEGAVSDLLETLEREQIISKNFSKRTSKFTIPKDLFKLDGKKQPFENPVFNKYEDMQDLLLIDPIHDVDEYGWPNQIQADTSAQK